jgi:CDP-glucose 4,6-dehydratase
MGISAMDRGSLFKGAFRGKTVFLTGHTGFVGSWMAIWLGALGARVVGFSLEPPSDPSLFEKAALAGRVTHIHGDVRDLEFLKSTMAQCEPDSAFHLAAQSLVRPSYDDPVGTYGTNIMGTVHFLEAVRGCPSIKACQVITTDKCYENRETGQAYNEKDPLGGYDPYSSSKAGAELVTAAYRRSFLHSDTAVATVRAGNIIGGGDWASDRLVPDCIRALQAGERIRLRNPDAVRPWQFILDPVAGYLHLASMMLEDPAAFCGPWNLGPMETESLTVGEVVDGIIRVWGIGSWEKQGGEDEAHEAKLLNLDISKATRELGFRPVYEVQRSIDETVSWYKQVHSNSEIDAYSLCLDQIRQYVEDARQVRAPWMGEVD